MQPREARSEDDLKPDGNTLDPSHALTLATIGAQDLFLHGVAVELYGW